MTSVELDEGNESRKETMIAIINDLLEKCKIERKVYSLQECSPSMFVLLLENMLQARIPNIQRDPITISQHHYNMELVLAKLRDLGVENSLDPKEFYPRRIPSSVCELIEIFEKISRIVFGEDLIDEDRVPPSPYKVLNQEIDSLNRSYHSQRSRLERSRLDRSRLDGSRLDGSMEYAHSPIRSKHTQQSSLKEPPKSDTEASTVHSPSSIKNQSPSKRSKVVVNIDEILEKTSPERPKSAKVKRKHSVSFRVKGKENKRPKSARSRSRPKKVQSDEELAKYQRMYTKYLNAFLSSKLADNHGSSKYHRSLKNIRRDQQIEKIRMKRFKDEQKRLYKSKRISRRCHEEILMKKMYKRILHLEKSRVIQENALSKQEREESDRNRRKRIDALVHFYKDQINVMKEILSKQKHDRHLASKAQRIALDRLSREMRRRQWTELEMKRLKMLSEEDAKYNKKFSEDQMASFIRQRVLGNL